MAEKAKKKTDVNFVETGKFIRTNVAALYMDKSRAKPPPNRLVQLVPNKKNLYSVNHYIKQCLKPHQEISNKPNMRFYGHSIRNKDGIIVTLDQLLKTRKLLMFIFCSGSSVTDEFLEELKQFYKGLAELPPIIELVLCPLDSCKSEAEAHFLRHANYFTFDSSSEFMWQLRFIYNIRTLKPCAIVVRRSGELITKDPFIDIKKHGSHAVNNWLI